MNCDTEMNYFTKEGCEKPIARKCFVLIVSETFPSGHANQFLQTYFAKKILSKEKIHTIRDNAEYWIPIIEQIQRGEAYLSLRKWTGKPYASKQKTITNIYNAGYEIIKPFTDKRFLINNSAAVFKNIVAHKDGLSRNDFDSWFKDWKRDEEKILIHFTDFRYSA